jgi:hypothetical protein
VDIENEKVTGHRAPVETKLTRSERDYALARLDEKEIKARMIEAFDAFLDLGYEVSLIGVHIHQAVEYRIELSSDGSGEMPLAKLTEIAEDYRLDMIVDKDMGLVAYARY